jgi:putative oxidoreductase
MVALLPSIVRPVALPSRAAEVLLLVPRVVCGVMLTVLFGAPKFGLPWSPVEANLGFFEVAFWFPTDVAAFGGVFAMAPVPFAWLAAFAEGVGGVALVLGIAVRPFAALLLATMSVAAIWQQLPQGYWNALPALGFGWVSLYLLVLGGGRWSVDAWLARRWAA